MNDEAQRWYAQGADDLGTAEILLESERFGPCAFFCQQAAEKLLKSALYRAGERPWGHSVSSLLDQLCLVMKIDPSTAPQYEAQTLEEHYMRPRYPDARTDVDAQYGLEEANEAMTNAHVVFTFVKENTADVGDNPDDEATADMG